MKKMLLFFVVSIFALASFAQDGASKKAEDYIKFKSLSYNFGKIKKGVPVTHDFVFTNSSDRPIVVEMAQASCGCTTPVWPQAPIGKGKSDKITAGFNAASEGAFTKTITVKLAGIETPVVLTISGEVVNS